MKNTLTLGLLLFQLTVMGQIQYNDFESSYDLDVQFDSSDSLWQIGAPQKTFFDAASSQPNALVTDTIENYPINSASSFILEITEQALFGFPYIQIEWSQKTDLEDGVDGGVIEASYDSGSTWSNVFSDTIYRPDVVGSYALDTLYNGQVGITGKADWSWVAICWGTFTGIQPEVDPTVLIRYTLYSDSIETNQEGWMFDDFRVVGEVIGVTTENLYTEPISVYPNPSQNTFYINQDFLQNEEVNLKVHDATGACILSEKLYSSELKDFEINLDNFPDGMYHLSFRVGGKVYSQKLVKLKGH